MNIGATDNNFSGALELFRKRLEDLYIADYAKTGQSKAEPNVSIDIGRKKHRVVVTTYGSPTTYCFIEDNSGHILMARGWNAAAPDSRGNIFNPGSDVGHDKPCNIHGGNLYKAR